MDPEVTANDLDAAIDNAGEGNIGDPRQEPVKDTALVSAPKPEDKPAANEPAKKAEPKKEEPDPGEKPPDKPSEEDVENVLLSVLDAETPEEAIAKAKQKGKDLHDVSMEAGNLRKENQSLKESLANLTGKVDALLQLKTGEVQDQSGNEESQEYSAMDLATDPDGFVTRIENALDKGLQTISERVSAVEQTVDSNTKIGEAKTQQVENTKAMEAKYGKKVWDAYNAERERLGKAVHKDKTMAGPEVFHLAAFGLKTLERIRENKPIVATREPTPKGGMGAAATGADTPEPSGADKNQQEIDELEAALDNVDPATISRYD